MNLWKGVFVCRVRVDMVAPEVMVRVDMVALEVTAAVGRVASAAVREVLAARIIAPEECLLR